jgi:5'-3' exonuclease
VTEPLLLVDTASLYYRAFHGIPATTMTSVAGQPANAVHGFLDLLTTLIRSRRPDRCVCALDQDWRPEWRVALIGAYKAHRVGPSGTEETPAALIPQVPAIVELLQAIGIATVGLADYEADDLLATMAATEPGPVEVATGDRDLLQVVSDARQVRLLDFSRSVAKLTVVDEAEVLKRHGVSAQQYLEYSVLRGDPSDGLPGVPGVGEKTAARLICEYGGLDRILATAAGQSSGLTPKLRARILESRDYLNRAMRVVSARTDLPLGKLDTRLPKTPADLEAQTRLSEHWQVTGPVRRLWEAMLLEATQR